MRIRPFFWLLLGLTCMGVLIFALTKPTYVPAVLQVHMSQHTPVSVGTATLELRLTDTQGIPINHARITSEAHMTNMDMTSDQPTFWEIGQGLYGLQVKLDMAGPWSITIVANAQGFASPQQTLLLQVQ